MTHERSVWHEVLSTQFLRSGLSIPGIHAHNSIPDLTAGELERLAVRAHRFWINWTSPCPKPTRHVVVSPTNRLWTFVSARNLACEFLPGHGGRYLLSLTLYERSSSDSEVGRFSFECWDISCSPPVSLATMLVANLVGYAVNSQSSSPHMLAVSRRENGG